MNIVGPRRSRSAPGDALEETVHEYLTDCCLQSSASPTNFDTLTAPSTSHKYFVKGVPPHTKRPRTGWVLRGDVGGAIKKAKPSRMHPPPPAFFPARVTKIIRSPGHSGCRLGCGGAKGERVPPTSSPAGCCTESWHSSGYSGAGRQAHPGTRVASLPRSFHPSKTAARVVPLPTHHQATVLLLRSGLARSRSCTGLSAQSISPACWEKELLSSCRESRSATISTPVVESLAKTKSAAASGAAFGTASWAE